MKVFKIVFAYYIIGLAFIESNGFSFSEISNTFFEAFQNLFPKKSRVLIHQSVTTEENENYSNLIEAIQKVYEKKLLPLEQASKYNIIEPPLVVEDFETKPIVLVIGNQSTDKTTFIEYILGEKFLDSNEIIESATDNFVYVKHGKFKKTINGDQEILNLNSPFKGLAKFGDLFLDHFKATELPNGILEEINFVYTPDVQEGHIDQNELKYDGFEVFKWFVERSDRILIFLDSKKKDVSPEMVNLIKEAMKYDEKVRFIVNMMHTFNEADLVRIHGALKAYLVINKAIDKHEKPRFYLTLFKRDIQNVLPILKKDMDDILKDLGDLPNKSSWTKLNKFNERVKRVLRHAYLTKKIQNRIPWFSAKIWGNDYYVKNLLNDLKTLINELKIEQPLLFKNYDNTYDTLKDQLLKLDYDSIETSDNLIENSKKILTMQLSDMVLNENEKFVNFTKEYKSEL